MRTGSPEKPAYTAGNHTAIHDKVCTCEVAEPLIQKQCIKCCDFFRVAICSSQYILGAALKDIP